MFRTLLYTKTYERYYSRIRIRLLGDVRFVSSSTPRTNIGIFGDMNSGKSLLMNNITQQNTSIVDSTPGTTADVKTSLIEFHGLGPVKIFDTPGFDDVGGLGQKKKQKTWSTLKEVDIAIFVYRDNRNTDNIESKRDRYVKHMEEVFRRNNNVLFLLNCEEGALDQKNDSILFQKIDSFKKSSILISESIEESSKWFPVIVDNLSDPTSGKRVSDHIVKAFRQPDVPLLLPQQYLNPFSKVFMNIPMDVETPKFRLLRPQAMIQEFCLRHFTTTVAFRMNLSSVREELKNMPSTINETERFKRTLKDCMISDDARETSLLVTDSQAIDVVHELTNDIPFETLGITTFSIAMINHMSGGNLNVFVEGLKAFQKLKDGDRILISEACNHLRITDTCEDIGTVQIPKHLANFHGESKLEIHHSFGREFPENLDEFALVIHCGACMIDTQKLRARMQDCADAGVPITNYGLLLSLVKAPQVLSRVLRPWGLQFDE